MKGLIFTVLLVASQAEQQSWCPEGYGDSEWTPENRKGWVCRCEPAENSTRTFEDCGMKSTTDSCESYHDGDEDPNRCAWVRFQYEGVSVRSGRRQNDAAKGFNGEDACLDKASKEHTDACTAAMTEDDCPAGKDEACLWAIGPVTDCDGTVFTADMCAYRTKDNCTDYLGDGICDYGQRYTRYGGLNGKGGVRTSPNFSCEKFNYDAGDCDCDATMTCDGYCLDAAACKKDEYDFVGEGACMNWLNDNVCDYGQRTSTFGVSINFDCHITPDIADIPRGQLLWHHDRGSCNEWEWDLDGVRGKRYDKETLLKNFDPTCPTAQPTQWPSAEPTDAPTKSPTLQRTGPGEWCLRDNGHVANNREICEDDKAWGPGDDMSKWGPICWQGYGFLDKSYVASDGIGACGPDCFCCGATVNDLTGGDWSADGECCTGQIWDAEADLGLGSCVDDKPPCDGPCCEGMPPSDACCAEKDPAAACLVDGACEPCDVPTPDCDTPPLLCLGADDTCTRCPKCSKVSCPAGYGPVKPFPSCTNAPCDLGNGDLDACCKEVTPAPTTEPVEGCDCKAYGNDRAMCDGGKDGSEGSCAYSQCYWNKKKPDGTRHAKNDYCHPREEDYCSRLYRQPKKNGMFSRRDCGNDDRCIYSRTGNRHTIFEEDGETCVKSPRDLAKIAAGTSKVAEARCSVVSEWMCWEKMHVCNTYPKANLCKKAYAKGHVCAWSTATGRCDEDENLTCEEIKKTKDCKGHMKSRLNCRYGKREGKDKPKGVKDKCYSYLKLCDVTICEECVKEHGCEPDPDTGLYSIQYVQPPKKKRFRSCAQDGPTKNKCNKIPEQEGCMWFNEEKDGEPAGCYKATLG